MPQLSTADRCDRCGAQAYTAWWKHVAKALLLLCKHHADTLGAALEDARFELTIDERDRLIVPALPTLTTDPATH